jgi:hypothetical protein
MCPGRKFYVSGQQQYVYGQKKKLFGHLGRPDKRNNAFFHPEDTYDGAFHYRTRVY